MKILIIFFNADVLETIPQGLSTAKQASYTWSHKVKFGSIVDIYILCKHGDSALPHCQTELIQLIRKH